MCSVFDYTLFTQNVFLYGRQFSIRKKLVFALSSLSNLILIFFFHNFDIAGNLGQLGVLSLRGNKLHYLPNQVGNCKELHVLDVAGNR